MANEFVQSFSTPGFDDVLNKFDKLTRKEQEALVKGSKLGRTWDQMGQKAKRSTSQASMGFTDMAKSLGLVFSAQEIVNRGFKFMAAELDRIKQKQRDAFQTQKTFAQARQNFIANNQAALQQTPALLDRVDRFARQQGAQLGKGGAAQVLSAITSVRSQIGTTATEKQQFAAIQAAVQGKVLDPSADIASLASANLRTQQALGVNRVQAQNVVSTFGEFAGGDINAFVGEFGKLKGLAGATKSKFSDVLALEGVISQASGLGPEQVTTIISQALGKLSSRSPKGARLQSKDAVGRLIELSTRAAKGEYGKNLPKILSEAGLEGGRGPQITGAIAGNLGQLAKARQQIAGAANANINLQERALGFLSPQARTQLRVQRQEGALDVTQINRSEDARREAEIRIFEAQRLQRNTSVFSDFGGGGERALIRGGLPAEIATALRELLVPGLPNVSRAIEDSVNQRTVSGEAINIGLNQASKGLPGGLVELGQIIKTAIKEGMGEARTDAGSRVPPEGE